MSDGDDHIPGGRYDDVRRALHEQFLKNEETIESLRRAEQKFRSIFEHAIEGIFQTTPDGRYLDANPALARMYGYDSPAELIAALTDINHNLYVNPNRRREFISLMREQGRVAEFESQVYHRDGKVIWISENARPVYDEVTGELLYYEGMVQDITRRKRDEEAHRQAEARRAAQYSVTRTLAEGRNLREVAGKIVSAICERVGWDFGDLWFVDPPAGVLRCVDMWHFPELNVAEFAEATSMMTFERGIDMPGCVWESGKPAWISDVVVEPDFLRSAFAAKDGLHGACAFPIPLGGEVVGVMEFFSRGVREPDDDLLALMVALGTQIGQFIERNRIADQLARYAEELRAKNAQLEADLEMARDIQQVFLTQNYPSFPLGMSPEKSWLRFCHCYRPAHSVGGDFFSVRSLSENEAGVFICDVVGHGLRAALVTAIVRGLVEELTSAASDPGHFLTEVNRSLYAILQRTETPMLASAFYFIVNVDTGDMAYANAGHPPALHVRREAGVVDAVGYKKGHGPVLGIFENTVYQTGHLTTVPQDLFVLFTDGLYEVEIANDEYYGQERLLAAVQNRMQLPVGEMFDEIIAEIQDCCLSRDFADDVCLVGMEVLSTGPGDDRRIVA